MMKIGSLIVIIGVMVMAPIFVDAQISIECLIDEEITAPECYDCTQASDTALFTGFRIIHSGVDTTMIEAPWRLKVRRNTNQFIFFDYRDEIKFSHIDSVDAFATLDDLIAYVKDCQGFTVVYGGGDSTRVVHHGDTMYITYPEPGGGSTDTTFQFALSVDGGTPDTITLDELVNLVSGTNMDISQSATNITFDALVDTCLHSLVAVTDSSFALLDCNDVPLDTVTLRFPGGGTDDQQITQFEISNDTIYLTLEDGGGQKFLVVQHPDTCFHSAEAITDSSFHILDCNGVPLDTVALPGPTTDQHLFNANLTLNKARVHDGNAKDFTISGGGSYYQSWASVNLTATGSGITLNATPNLISTASFNTSFSSTSGGTYFHGGDDGVFFSSDSAQYYFDDFPGGYGNFVEESLPPINDTLQYAIVVDTALGRWYLRDIGSTSPDSLEYRGDSIAIIGSNAINIFDIIDSTGWGVDIDTDSQSLSLINDTLGIARGNSVDLNDYRDTVKLKPFHEIWTNVDSLLVAGDSFDTLATYNNLTRWRLFDNRIDAMSVGKGARADYLNSTAVGARAFPYRADTLGETVANTQIDTQNNVITGLSTYITYLGTLGYQVGDPILIDWALSSGEMPFIDTPTVEYVPEKLHSFIIASSSTLDPTEFNFDSAATGSYTLTAGAYLEGSTAIGHDAVVDKPHQISLGDSTTQELKLGDSIRMKIDTSYTHFQLVGFDSTQNQLIPIDAAAFGFTPDADFWEIGVDASPGSITDNTYTLGQTVFAADTSVNSYYVQVVPPNGDGINVRDPFSDDVDIMWSGTTYSWAWRLENDAFFLQDAGDPGVGTGVYISALNGYDDPDPILELQTDGGMQWSNYGIGSPRDGGSDFYAIPFVDGGGGVYQLRPDDFLDSLDLTDLGDSSGVTIPDGEIYVGTGTRGATSFSNLTSTGSITYMPSTVVTGSGATTGTVSIKPGWARSSDGTTVVDIVGDQSSYPDYGFRFARYSNGATVLLHRGTGEFQLVGAEANNFRIRTGGNSPTYNRLSIDPTGNVGINESSPSAKLHVDGTVRLDNLSADAISGVLYYDGENDIGRRSLNDLQNDLDIPAEVTVVPNTRIPYSNGTDYTSSSTFYYSSSQVHVPQLRVGSANKFAFIQSGNDLYIQPVTSDGIVFVRNQSGVNRFQIESDGDVKIFGDLDLDGTFIEGASDIGASNEYIKSNGSGGWTWTQPNFGHLTAVPAGLSDGDDDNQDLSYTAATRVMAISDGTNATIPLFTSSNPGLVDASGGGTTNFLRADGSWAAPSGSADDMGTSVTSGYVVYGQGSAVPDFESSFSYAEGTNTLSIGNVDIDDADGMTTPTNYSFDNTSGEELEFVSTGETNLLVDGSWVMRNTNTNSNIFNDAFIGQNTDDQLQITSSSGSHVQIQHEDITSDAAYIRFNDNGNINIIGSGSFVSIDAGSSSSSEVIIDGNIQLGTLGSNGSRVFTVSTGVAPTTSPANAAQMYAEDVSSSAKMKVRDEDGTITTISPHNFSSIPEGPSEELAWSHHSTRDGKHVNVDMLRTVRLVEQMSGEKLVYTNSDGKMLEGPSIEDLMKEVQQLKQEIENLKQK